MDQAQSKSPFGRVLSYDEAIQEGCGYVLTVTPFLKGVRFVFFPLEQEVINAYTRDKDIILHMGSTFSTDMFVRCSEEARNLNRLQDELPLDKLIEKEKAFFRLWVSHVIGGNIDLWPLYISGRLKDEYPVDISQLHQRTVEAETKEESEKEPSVLPLRKRKRPTSWRSICLCAFCFAAFVVQF